MTQRWRAILVVVALGVAFCAGRASVVPAAMPAPAASVPALERSRPCPSGPTAGPAPIRTRTTGFDRGSATASGSAPMEAPILAPPVAPPSVVIGTPTSPSSGPAEALASTGTITGTVTGGSGPLWVWVDGPAAGGPRAPVEVDQVGTRFVPGALVVPVGTEVVFWNSGPELHDVYGIQGADRFDVGTYEPGSARRRVFDQAGPVQIGCNKHEWMHLDLLVTPNPWFASVDHGRFRVDGVPAGERTVAVWGPRVRGESTATVTVPAGGEVEARMALPR